MVSLTAGRSLAAAMLAAIGASVCCVGPLLLLALFKAGQQVVYGYKKS